MKAQPRWVSCQIHLEVWLNPLPAFASIFLSGKILLHPQQQCSGPLQKGRRETMPLQRRWGHQNVFLLGFSLEVGQRGWKAAAIPWLLSI